jgi:hypothetical protein
MKYSRSFNQKHCVISSLIDTKHENESWSDNATFRNFEQKLFVSISSLDSRSEKISRSVPTKHSRKYIQRLYFTITNCSI